MCACTAWILMSRIQETNKTSGPYIKCSDRNCAKMSKTLSQYEAFVGQISEIWKTQPNWTKEQLAKINVSKAIVLGDHDEAVTRNHTEYMASINPPPEPSLSSCQRQPFRHVAGTERVQQV